MSFKNNFIGGVTVITIAIYTCFNKGSNYLL